MSRQRGQDKLTEEARARLVDDIQNWPQRISNLRGMESALRRLIHETDLEVTAITAEMATTSATWVADQARRGVSGCTNGPRGPPGQEERRRDLEEAQGRKRDQEHELRRVLMRKKEAEQALEQAQLTLTLEDAKDEEAKK